MAGVAVFALFYFLLSSEAIMSMGVGIAAFVIVIAIFMKKQKDSTIVVEGMTKLDIENTIRSGRKYTAGMRQACQSLLQMEVRNEIEDLCRIADSIFEMLKRDPKDIRIVKHFITYYLEPTHKIICKYAELATTRPMPADAIVTLERTEKSLKSIRATFLQQKEKMLANDVIDLDTEIKVFETVSSNMRTNDSGFEQKKPPTSSRP